MLLSQVSFSANPCYFCYCSPPLSCFAFLFNFLFTDTIFVLVFFPISAFFPVLTYHSLCLSPHVSLPLHLICVTPHFSYLCVHFSTGKQLTLHPVLPEILSLVCINLEMCRSGSIKNIVNHFLILISVLKRHHLLRGFFGMCICQLFLTNSTSLHNRDVTVCWNI